MTLSARAVETAINEHDDYYWDELGYYLNKSVNLLEVDGENYPIEVIEDYTGHEGDWERTTFVVFKVGDQIFKKTGYYQSHYGNDWDGPCIEVEQVEKTVKVWEAKSDF